MARTLPALALAAGLLALLAVSAVEAAPRRGARALLGDGEDDGSGVSIAIKAFNATGAGGLLGDGPATIFAPTDKAFKKLASYLNLSASDLLSSPVAVDILKLHVVPGAALRSTDLPDGQTVDATSLAGAVLKVTRSGSDVTVGVAGSNKTADVVKADIPFNAAIVHVIDKVLVPPSGTTK
ncbi:hypothetical protein HYH03_006855 [Edaphochlamys debaryana]|uniref:FAS1 domain-containing protein n=1 Tax=Edaphochlamys debaryana TaxID=47281 RepID=A0A836BZQ8_9CHLO|nr:hypothetical protein HYH03_006855 [Edaphochlamys debaryana]|eukprot:KAG2494920.1 hypothetical protein HYH03_006855 [Edaphochlamys debaryana]